MILHTLGVQVGSNNLDLGRFRLVFFLVFMLVLEDGQIKNFLASRVCLLRDVK